jgi:hypothetical protein
MREPGKAAERPSWSLVKKVSATRRAKIEKQKEHWITAFAVMTTGGADLLRQDASRLLKKISEARRAKNRRAEAYLASTL